MVDAELLNTLRSFFNIKKTFLKMEKGLDNFRKHVRKISKKMLEQFIGKSVARNCSKLLNVEQVRAVSSSFLQQSFAKKILSSFLKSLVFKILVFFPLDRTE